MPVFPDELAPGPELAPETVEAHDRVPVTQATGQAVRQAAGQTVEAHDRVPVSQATGQAVARPAGAGQLVPVAAPMIVPVGARVPASRIARLDRGLLYPTDTLPAGEASELGGAAVHGLIPGGPGEVSVTVRPRNVVPEVSPEALVPELIARADVLGPLGILAGPTIDNSIDQYLVNPIRGFVGKPPLHPGTNMTETEYQLQKKIAELDAQS